MYARIEWETQKKCSFGFPRGQVLPFCHMKLYTVRLPRRGIAAELRIRYAAWQMRRRDIRHALFPIDFPYTALFARCGIVPFDETALRLNCAEGIVRCAMRQNNIRPHTAVLSVLCDRMTRQLADALTALAADIRYIRMAPCSGSETFAQTLLLQQGIAVTLNSSEQFLYDADIVLLLREVQNTLPSHGLVLPLLDSALSVTYALPEGITLPASYPAEQLLCAICGMGVLSREKLSVARIERKKF